MAIIPLCLFLALLPAWATAVEQVTDCRALPTYKIFTSELTDTTAELELNMPSSDPNNCPVLNLQMECKAQAMFRCFNYSHAQLDKFPLRVSMFNLRAKTEYNCSATLFNPFGPTVTSVKIITKEGAPGPVRNLTVEVKSDRTRFTWRIGCDSGDVGHFLVELVGTRRNHCSTYYNFTRNITQPLEESFSANIATLNLTAEALYIVAVTPVSSNGTHGVKQTSNFTVPARIPAEPLKVNSSLLRVEHVGASSAQVHLHRDLFPDTEGQMMYYAILVVENNFTNPPQAKSLPFGSWPNHSTWAQAQTQPTRYYQATPTRWQPSFKDEKSLMVIFAVGVNNSCSVMDKAHYCNGPLKASTHYSLRVRGFTVAGYRDSQQLTFQTDEASSLVSVLVSVLVLLTATAAVMFLYKATKEHLHWLLEQKIQGQKHCGYTTSEFVNHAEELLANKAALQEEFKELADFCQLIQAKQEVARLPENKKMNRYTNILPYDKNRVRVKGKHKNDYINASHIMLKNGKSVHYYLACQGPKESECENFWTMMIQNEVSIIVMMCMPRENGKEKCFPYFPMLGNWEMYGEIKVHCVTELNNTNYIIRNLRVEKGRISVEFIQFHYTSWPDFGVPSVPKDLVLFVAAVRRAHRQNTVIAVHCSAGVGRSGTFIAVDALLNAVYTFCCKINVLQIVYKLRQQRCNMVQTEKQYEYIYKCVKYAIENNPLSLTKGLAKMSPLVAIDDLSNVDSLKTPGNNQKEADDYSINVQRVK